MRGGLWVLESSLPACDHQSDMHMFTNTHTQILHLHTTASSCQLEYFNFNTSKDAQETCEEMYEMLVTKRHFKLQIEKYLKENKCSESEV